MRSAGNARIIRPNQGGVKGVGEIDLFCENGGMRGNGRGGEMGEGGDVGRWGGSVVFFALTTQNVERKQVPHKSRENSLDT